MLLIASPARALQQTERSSETPTRRSDHVVIVSIDGFRPDFYLDKSWPAPAIQQMADDGVKRVLTFITGAYSSYSGCRQYRENIMAAQAQVGINAPRVDKLRFYYNHPAFVAANA